MIIKRKGSVTVIIMVLVLVLIFPTAASSAKTLRKASGKSTELTMQRSSKVLYVGGCKGKKADGTPAKLYRRVNVAKYINGFDSDTMKLMLVNSNKDIVYVNQKKHLIYARKTGKASVQVQVISRADGSVLYEAPFSITVKKNADAESFAVDGIEDGDEFEAGETITISISGDFTDQKTVVCDDESVEIVKGKKAGSFEITFTESGEFSIVAAAYQSRTYPGYTVSQSFDVEVYEEASILQTGLHTVEITGDVVFEDISPKDVKVYEIADGIDVFFSNVEGITFEDNRAEIRVFKGFESGREYAVDLDGSRLYFTSAGTDIDDIDRIVLDIETAVERENVTVPIRYYSASGIELTELYSSKWDSQVKISYETDKAGFVSMNGKNICFYAKDITAKLTATLELPVSTGAQPAEGTENQEPAAGDIADRSYRILTAQTEIVSIEKPKPQYTGTCIYTFTEDDGIYLTASDAVSHSIVIGDNVVFEALLLYSDGKYRTLKEAGVTSVVVADNSILMQKSSLFSPSGGIGMITNSIGDTGLILYCRDEVLETFDVSVLEKRHADRMEVSLSKTKLNSNFCADDYLIIKADVYDQYGGLFDAGPVRISQQESNKKAVGEVVFSSVVNGRLIVYGTDCMGVSDGGTVIVEISCGSFSENKSFTVRNIVYDESESDEYDISLKQDGPSVLDATLLKKDTEPDNVLFTIEVMKDGYFVTELSPQFLAKMPNISQKPQEYGISESEVVYGVLVERTPFATSSTIGSAKEKAVVSEENDCIISSYLGLEFWAYQYGSSLDSGLYTVTLYCITGNADGISIKECGEKKDFRVVDSQPEIEIDQIAENAEISGSADWVSNIKKFFKFYLEGEEITQYVTKVACNEAAAGLVFVKTVDFRIPNGYYGLFDMTADVGILVTKK